MTPAEVEAALAEIDRLIDAEDYETARDRLAGLPPGGDALAVRKLALSLHEGGLDADVVMVRLTQIMRKNPSLECARALYQRASNWSYSSGRSSPAHSHPPPPPRRDE